MELKLTFKFATKYHIENSLSEKELLSSVVEKISQYSQEICQILRLLLKKFADGFAYQKKNIFEFGDGKENSQNVTKISELSDKDI